ncbi:MAG: sensor histidine kinase [Lachnospiraceae bacterium]|jgi:signal transduction histidine kinase|nr:sensor histidine kinase [Lachnospiraceae bacterium]
MTVREFIHDGLGRLLLHLISMAALAAFLHLTGTAGGIVVIVLCVWVLGLVITQIVLFIKEKRQLATLDSIMKGLDKKYLFAECVEIPKCYYERKLFLLMRRSGKAMIEAVSSERASRQEYREYIESWVHEIKSPITTAELIAGSATEAIRRKLTPELASIENHVERALYYARADHAETDFLIKKASLEKMVIQALDKHRTLLIQSGIRIEMEQLDRMVYTDSKWVVFILGQLLQNAVRYRGESPYIRFHANIVQQQVQLVIYDNGIGIPTHELPRIFDRGFSGSNGRQRGGSTGMGLYISRKLATHMSVELRATSDMGHGTTITMTFPKNDMNHSYLTKV